MKKKTYITPAQQVVRLETTPLLASMSVITGETTTDQWAPGLIFDDEE